MTSRPPSFHRSPPTGGIAGLRSRQRGFSLIVALMMLIVIVLLGVSSSQMAINEERGARGNRDRQIAFQAAEAAIKDAEFEIYGSSTNCTVPGYIAQGVKMRPTTSTCFSESFQTGYLVGCTAPPNPGLCLPGVKPAYLDPNVTFLADAQGSGSATNHTVPYGQFTGKTFAWQGNVSGGSSQPLSKYLPRYIIEIVPKNVAIETDPRTVMFRVTAIGFGANANTQVVLQAIVATQY